MAGKNNRKHQLPSGDNQEGNSEMVVEQSDDRSMLEVFITNQSRKDEETRERLLQAEIKEEKRAVKARKDQAAAEERIRKEQIAAEERAEERRVAAAILAEERRVAASILAEERRLAAVVAAEEREELRRERAKIAEEERMEARSIAKDKRRQEEAMRLEDANRERDEAARLAADRAAAVQEEANQKAYEQQKVLVELQAELGEKAAEAQRLDSQRARKRDRAIAGIPNYQKGEDVEDFLLTSERKLRAGEIPKGEWLPILASKLNGEVGASWQELCIGTDEYQDVRTAVLKGCGYTPKAAGEAYHAFRYEQLKGLAADQVYRKGAQLLKRMVAPMVLEKELEFKLVKPWVFACVGRKARLF